MSNDEAAMNTGRPLASGRVGQLIDILEADEDEDEDEEISPSLPEGSPRGDWE